MALDEPRHEIYARLRVEGNSKRDAAIGAGYSEKSASAIGSRLANNVKIKQRIDELAVKIDEKVVETVVKAETRAITNRDHRLALLQDLADRMLLVAAERTTDPIEQAKTGGKSGLLAAQIKVVRTPKGLQAGYEYVLDTGFIRELRAVAQQAAQESGQWQNNDIDQSAGRGKVYIGTHAGEEEAKPLNADALATAGKGLSVQ